MQQNIFKSSRLLALLRLIVIMMCLYMVFELGRAKGFADGFDMCKSIYGRRDFRGN